MIERLVFLFITLVLSVLAYPYHLSYISFAVGTAFIILLLGYVRGEKELSEPQLGYLAAAIGVSCLLIAFYVSSTYGVSFEVLDQDRSFPRFIRRLPFFGISFSVIGAVIVATSIFSKHEP